MGTGANDFASLPRWAPITPLSWSIALGLFAEFRLGVLWPEEQISGQEYPQQAWVEKRSCAGIGPLP
jgi:hypothetical protein